VRSEKWLKYANDSYFKMMKKTGRDNQTFKCILDRAKDKINCERFYEMKQKTAKTRKQRKECLGKREEDFDLCLDRKGELINEVEIRRDAG
jgi:hypothetical protein